MTGDEVDAKALALPELTGGWALECFWVPDLDEGVDLELYVPCEPDALLDDVVVQERNRYNDAMPYWAWIWDSAPHVLGSIIRGLGSDRKSARVLEVGAGLGFVGLGLAKALGPAAQVLVTDHDPDAVQTLRAQIERNGLSNASAMELDWNDASALEGQSFDVVIGCDVAYEARSHAPLLELLAAALAPFGVAWFADPGRTRAPGFKRRAEELGWRVETLDENDAKLPLEAGRYRALRLTRDGARERAGHRISDEA